MIKKVPRSHMTRYFVQPKASDEAEEGTPRFEVITTTILQAAIRDKCGFSEIKSRKMARYLIEQG